MQTNHCTIFSLPLHRLDPAAHTKNKQALIKRFCREVQYAVADGVCVFSIALCAGTSLWLAEEIIRLRNTNFPQIALHVYIPYETQANDWDEAIRETYYDIQAEADEVFLLAKKWSSGVLHQQNQALLKAAGRLIVIHDGILGGFSDKLYAYSERKGIEAQVIELFEGPKIPRHLMQSFVLHTAYYESKSQVRSIYFDGLSKGKSASNSAW